METRKGRTRATKLTAVLASDMTSTLAASQAMGIPESTLRHWRDDPDMARYRVKAREDLLPDIQVLAAVAMDKLIEAVRAGKVDPRDLITAMGVALDKAQLLSGGATHRVESRDITDVFDDHETRRIVAAAQEYVAGDGPGEGQALVAEPAVEGAGA